MRLRSWLSRGLTLGMILTLLINTNGCVNRKEVNKLGLLGDIGVDFANNQTVLTMEVTKPRRIAGGGPTQQEPYVVVQSSGDSFFDALRNATNKFDRKIFLASSRIFIISGELAKGGITPILDMWYRDHEAREAAYLLITKDCNASDIIGVAGGVDDVPSQYLSDLIKANDASSKSVDKNVNDFMEEYYGDGIQPTLGVVQVEKKAQPINKNDTEVLLEGAAVFREDELVGYLDGIQTRALNFLKSQVQSGIIVVPQGNDTSDSIEIIKAKSKLDATLQNNQFNLKATITIEGMLGEDQTTEDLDDPEVMKQLENKCASIVKEQASSVIKYAQQNYKLDIFGFGQSVHRKYPDSWKKLRDNWDEIFAKSKYQVDVNVHISRSGLFREPIKAKLRN
jgi:spore germination protein KC